MPLLIFDQFEELVTLFEENPKDEERFQSARGARADIEQLLCQLLLQDPLPLKIVFGFRDDYLARITPLFLRIPNLMDQGVRLALRCLSISSAGHSCHRKMASADCPGILRMS
jgi:hypothetical protein